MRIRSLAVFGFIWFSGYPLPFAFRQRVKERKEIWALALIDVAKVIEIYLSFLSVS